jgi:hypothetical protein
MHPNVVCTDFQRFFLSYVFIFILMPSFLGIISSVMFYLLSKYLYVIFLEMPKLLFILLQPYRVEGPNVHFVRVYFQSFFLLFISIVYCRWEIMPLYNWQMKTSERFRLVEVMYH